MGDNYPCVCLGGGGVWGMGIGGGVRVCSGVSMEV